MFFHESKTVISNSIHNKFLYQLKAHRKRNLGMELKTHKMRVDY